jgi:integrase
MRRTKGEGSITRRSDGRWQSSYLGSDGKRRYLYAQTRKEISAKHTAALRELEMGVYVAGPTQSVEQFFRSWLVDLRDRVKPRTHERYEGQVRLHVTPVIGKLPLRKVTPQHIADLLASRRESHSAASVVHLRTVLRSAFAQAVKWNLIARNPVDAVSSPRPQRRPMTVLSPAQSQILIQETDGTEMGTLYRMALHTGMRQGELLALRWRDVDLSQGLIDVNATLVRTGGQWLRSSTKSKAGTRRVAMAPTLRSALSRHRALQAERLLAMGIRIDDDSLLFTDGWGNPLNGAHITERSFKPLLRSLELPAVRFHDLRHAFASMMLSQGVRVDLVSQMLGHASAVTTLSVYAHLMPGDQDEAMRRLEAVLRG